MKKVRMIVEMDEELYKAFTEQDIFISGMRTGKTLLSEIWKALKSATIVRMSEEKIKESCSLSLVYNEGFDKGYEKAKAEYEPKECDDCVSKKAVMALLDKWYCHKEPYERKEGNTVYKGYDTYYMINFDKLKALPPVIPKREQGAIILNGNMSANNTKEMLMLRAMNELEKPKRDKGEWIEVHPLQEDDGGAYMCSKCKCGHPYISPHWKYCPNCGAEMR